MAGRRHARKVPSSRHAVAPRDRRGGMRRRPVKVPMPGRALGLMVAVPVTLAVAVGVGSAFGAIPNPGDGRFYACRVKDSGAVHMINYPKVDGCPKGQKLIDWGRTGPQGPQGTAGAQGAPGAQGRPGCSGAAGSPGCPGTAGITKITVTQSQSTGTTVGPNACGSGCRLSRRQSHRRRLLVGLHLPVPHRLLSLNRHRVGCQGQEHRSR